MILNKITDAEYTMMNIFRDENVSTDIANAKPMKEILKVWEKAKEETLYKLLGDELIISKEINVEKDETVLLEEIYDKLSIHNFISNYKRFISQNSDIINASISDENDSNIDVSRKLGYIKDHLLSENTLLHNRYNGPEIVIKYQEEGKDNISKYKFSNGAKIFKVLSKILDIFDASSSLKSELEEFRLIHSQIFNEKTVKGELCLSIHPFDYMTMSDNECGWSSCMSWRREGDYRLGTVEMMNSPLVVVAYIKSSVDMPIYKNYSWNSKRWRELFVITKDVIAGIKGYPYWSKALEKEVLNWIKDLAKKNLGWEYRDEIYTLNCNNDCHRLEENKNIEIIFLADAMYNDFYSSHQVLLSTDVPVDEDECYYYKSINYSGSTQCMICGEAAIYYNSENDLHCEHCDTSWYCEECGDRQFASIDNAYLVDGKYLCDYCFENLPVCNNCGSPHLQDAMEEVYIMINDTNDLTTLHFNLDEDCITDNDLFDYSKIKTATVNYSYSDHTFCCIHYDDLTEVGKDYADRHFFPRTTPEDYEGPFYYYEERKENENEENN